MIPPELFPWFAAVLGAFAGSFLNVVIYRLPRENLSVARPMFSFCPACRTPIRWYDNIPILSYLLLTGRCRQCRKAIPLRYPFIETSNAALWVWVALELAAADPLSQGAALFWMVLLSALLALSVIDIDHQIIPDEISVNGTLVAPIAACLLPGVPVCPRLPKPLIDAVDLGLAPDVPAWAQWIAMGAAAAICGVLFRRLSPASDGSRRSGWDCRLALVLGGTVAWALWGLLLVPDWLQKPGSLPLTASLLGMAVGAGTIWGVGVLGKLAFRKQAMGFGDVKLMALLGAVLGWSEVLIALVIACFLGAVIGIAMRAVTRSSYIPFGPFLSAGGVILILCPTAVNRVGEWYWEVSRRADPRVLLAVSLLACGALLAVLWRWRRR